MTDIFPLNSRNSSLFFMLQIPSPQCIRVILVEFGHEMFNTIEQSAEILFLDYPAPSSVFQCEQIRLVVANLLKQHLPIVGKSYRTDEISLMVHLDAHYPKKIRILILGYFLNKHVDNLT